MQKTTKKTGTVYLVGAGPGDVGLLTTKALHFLEQADVIVYDFLANEAFLKNAKSSAEKIYVGKQSGSHTLSQDKINDLLIEKAKTTDIVVRLKGGDPFMFGRGGEEALALQKAHIPFEIIPGVTSGIAALAYAGIPATQRAIATSVSFITGHEDPTKNDSQLDWHAISHMHGTLVFYMGVKNLNYIVTQLLHYGRSAETPVALIRYGTIPEQKTVTGTLANIVEKINAAALLPPALIVVGEVVTLRDELNWFETKPLFGKRIVVTRSRSQASDLVLKLESLGAHVIAFPTIETVPPANVEPLNRAIQDLNRYAWIVFTSVNGVDSFMSCLEKNNLDARALAGCQLCCIGPATSKRLRDYGLITDLQPKEYVAESVIDEFKTIDISKKTILLPRADIARANLRQGLESLALLSKKLLPIRPLSMKIIHMRYWIKLKTVNLIWLHLPAPQLLKILLLNWDRIIWK